MRVQRLLATCLVGLLAVPAVLEAQTTSAELRGSVVDQQQSAVAGATVTLENEGTSDTRTATTNDGGLFVFAAIVPGTYRVKIDSPGFATFRQTGITINANERRGLGMLQLQIAGLETTVAVAATSAVIRSTSSETSSSLNAQQLSDLVTRGRDVVNLLRVLPGVTATGDVTSVGGAFGTSTPNISGVRAEMNTVSLDGQVGQDNDLQGFFQSSTSLDAIAEVVVLRNNYQAEYGRNGGAVVNIITKSGTRDFKGSLATYIRNEKLNANEFFNIRNGLPKPLYRYTTFSGTIGGPVYIPGKMSRDQSKLFFFYSREDWRTKTPAALRQVTVPSALERNGDFSQTLDTNSRLIIVRDPATGLPFPGNIVPAGRINPLGQALLNVFPLPNFTDRQLSGGNYNYQFQDVVDQPKTQNLLRMDYRASAKDQFQVRGRTWRADQKAFNPVAGSSANWDWFRFHYLFTEDSIQGSYTRVLSPKAVNEFNVSYRELGERSPYDSTSVFGPASRSERGLSGLGQFNPQGNPLGILPALGFGGVQNAANIGYDGRMPIDAWDTRLIALDNLTVTTGNHTLKGGFYLERNKGTEGPRSNYGGTFQFGRDVNNPADTNYAYSNALLGNFTTYSESSARTSALNKRLMVEWFGQDSWRASHKLTVEAGVRFSWASALKFPDGDAAAFVLDRYDRSHAPLLIQPVRNPQGQRVGQNPVTGEFVPAILIGSFVPSSGDPFNGTVTPAVSGYEDGFVSSGGVQLGPRLGLAYDLRGDGKTALRANFSMTRNMQPNNGLWAGGANTNPPNQVNPQLVYGNVSTYLNSTGVLFPVGSVSGWDRDYKIPTVYSWSGGVQRDIGFGMVAEATYVGNRVKNLSMTRDLNLLPPGTRFLPENQDPSLPGTPLPDNFLRPYPGYGSIVEFQWNGYSNYDALQASLNHNFRKGVAFSVAYTLSKSVDLGTGLQSRLPTYLDPETYVRDLSTFDQPHVFTATGTWNLPALSSATNNNGFVKAIFDDWAVSGIVTLASGQPVPINFSTTTGADLTGGGDPQRVNVTGPLNLPRGQRTFERWFAVENVALPGKGDFGNASRVPVRGPGQSNVDLSLVKRIPMGARSRYAEFRWEVYNLFNTFQYAGIDSTARFDALGKQVNPQFGQVTSARPPRVMQAALRFVF
jgi:Carboxypeptidase regulatory-like domain/TonB-dependent Receptor Plug Domain